ncbi:hypothetical protein LOTGIDRAFT_159075 [Lottia gigantea]|uniref:Protein amnionless n=1 Tax=Lottia gigantea TaxID=225164 RepID=V4C945_LOTGI|nr:hypothetical protein LOTGIDRAFT_159075 [Lottia gigantea]ESO98279.1 hypothetical protein LOTGIDRAFT_159075 [Lottia gigantea]
MNCILIFSGFLCSLNFVTVEGLYKRWLPNTNFENSDNWNVGRVPCGSDVVKFSNGESLSPTVYVQTNSTMKELWLPMNGEIIFGANSILSFTDSVRNTEQCPDAEGELEFIRGPKDWLDPDNWCTTATEMGECLNTPQLESERVPGTYDDVIFPTEKSFFVYLGVNLNYKVKSLKISGSSLTTSSFSTFAKSAEGTRMFPPPQLGAGTQSTVTVTRSTCRTPKSGCSYGNDQPQILDEICKIYQDRCERARCKSALTPLGACCSVCGATFNVKIDTGFNITELKEILQSQFLSPTPKIVPDVLVSRMSVDDNLVQIVMKDKTGETSSKIAKTIKADMDKDLSNGGHKYAISVVSLAVSGSATSGPGSTSAHTGGGNLSGGSVAAIILIVVIIIPLICLVGFYMWSRHHNSRNVVTTQVDKVLNNIQSIRRRADDRAQLTMTELGPVQTSFANEMYGAPLDDMNIQDFNLSLSETQPSFDRSGFDNPLYGSKELPSLYGDPSSGSKL